jgi:hypothetical protein
MLIQKLFMALMNVALETVVCEARRPSKPSRATDGLWKALDFS